VFADTVGFIRKLPHHLVASFKSTLEEIALANVVLHVVDRSHLQWREHLAVGTEVLADLGVEPHRILTVFNKSDLVGETVRKRDKGLWVSAQTGEGIDRLKEAVLESMTADSEAPNKSGPSRQITL
jgi:GTP-binding protein HflX